MTSRKFLGFAALTFLLACGKAPELKKPTGLLEKNENISVELLNAKDERVFAKLPLTGDAYKGSRLWSGDYWALNRGNINKRWNEQGQDGFDYRSPTKEEAFQMTAQDLAKLSPSEKFDLFTGHYDYPLRAEVNTRANPYAKYWEGICNGWSPASINHNEPLPKIVINPDGIPIPFGSSDIKAVLSYYYAFKYQAPTGQQGTRCERGGGWFNDDEECRSDLSPATFHIILANKVGLKKESFLADIQRYKEVWNHPIASYISTVKSEKKPNGDVPEGTVNVIRVESKIEFINGSENFWEPVIGTKYQTSDTKIYVYDLYLDQEGRILEGKWKSNDRPDFLWMMPKADVFQGQFASLPQLLND